MKRTVKLSLGMSLIMLVLVLIAPHLASPKLVLRFLPDDVYEAGKNHPAPSLPKQLLCHLLLAMAAVYMVWAYKDVADGIKKERLSFLRIEMLVVRKKYQGQGYMRQMMEYAYALADERISLLMSVSAFCLGFTNGLMSESMLIWFGIMLFYPTNINEVYR